MFKTQCYRTAKSFKAKGYRVIKTNFGEWYIFLAGEEIPKEILRAEEIRNAPKRHYTKRKQLAIRKVIKRRKRLQKKRGRPKKGA